MKPTTRLWLLSEELSVLSTVMAVTVWPLIVVMALVFQVAMVTLSLIATAIQTLSIMALGAALLIGLVLHMALTVTGMYYLYSRLWEIMNGQNPPR